MGCCRDAWISSSEGPMLNLEKSAWLERSLCKEEEKKAIFMEDKVPTHMVFPCVFVTSAGYKKWGLVKVFVEAYKHG